MPKRIEIAEIVDASNNERYTILLAEDMETLYAEILQALENLAKELGYDTTTDADFIDAYHVNYSQGWLKG